MSALRRGENGAGCASQGWRRELVGDELRELAAGRRRSLSVAENGRSRSRQWTERRLRRGRGCRSAPARLRGHGPRQRRDTALGGGIDCVEPRRAGSSVELPRAAVTQPPGSSPTSISRRMSPARRGFGNTCRWPTLAGQAQPGRHELLADVVGELAVVAREAARHVVERQLVATPLAHAVEALEDAPHHPPARSGSRGPGRRARARARRAPGPRARPPSSASSGAPPSRLIVSATRSGWSRRRRAQVRGSSTWPEASIGARPQPVDMAARLVERLARELHPPALRRRGTRALRSRRPRLPAGRGPRPSAAPPARRLDERPRRRPSSKPRSGTAAGRREGAIERQHGAQAVAARVHRHDDRLLAAVRPHRARSKPRASSAINAAQARPYSRGAPAPPASASASSSSLAAAPIGSPYAPAVPGYRRGVNRKLLGIYLNNHLRRLDHGHRARAAGLQRQPGHRTGALPRGAHDGDRVRPQDASGGS